MNHLINGFFLLGFLFLGSNTQIALAVTCPDPEKVAGSLGNYNPAEKETSNFVDLGAGQQDVPSQRYAGQRGLQFQARPNCYSSQNFSQRGCPENSLSRLSFSHAVLNRFRSGDNGTVWCYYTTPTNTIVAVNMNAASGGTYRIANPVGAGWGGGRLMFRCQANDVQNCSFEFAEGRLPNVLFR